jgi:hypothetical protein
VGQELTYTCVPPGSGVRVALDRDLDGRFDGDEGDDGTDPADPASVVGACSDGIDNDGDGAADLADAGCADAAADDESPACDDGFDNDGDGLVDGADPGCADPSGASEKGGDSRCGLLGLEALAALGLVRGWRRRRGGRTTARA